MRSRHTSMDMAGIGPGQWAFPVAAVATTGLLVASAWVAADGEPSRTAIWLVAASVPYLMLWSAPIPPSLRRVWPPLLLASIAGFAMVVVERNPLSDDVYRFAWDARVWLSGRSAYDYAPTAPALAALRDPAVYAHINHPTIPTIYPPFAQALFVLGYGIGGGPIGIKLLGLLGHLMTAAWLPVCVRALGASRDDPTGARDGSDARDGSTDVRDASASVRAGWLLALNPLSLSAGALGGHFDLYLGLCLLLATCALVAGRLWKASAWIVGSVGLKLIGVFVIPLLARRPRVAVVASLAALALAAPLTWSGSAGDSTPGLAHFGQRWQGNAGPFVLLTTALDPIVAALASEPTEADGLGPDELLFRPLRPLLEMLEGLGVRPKSALTARLKPQRAIDVFPRHHAVGLLARAAVAASVVAIACLAAFWVARRRGSVHGAVRLVLWALLLWSPQVHPWYLLWLLPLDLAAGGRAAALWSLVILGAYAPLPGWQAARAWDEATWYVVAEYALVLAAIAVDVIDLPRKKTAR